MDDDDSCVMKYIEIVPLDNFSNFSDDITHIKQEPDTVKVYISYLFMYQLTPEYWHQFIILIFHDLDVDFLFSLQMFLRLFHGVFSLC